MTNCGDKANKSMPASSHLPHTMRRYVEVSPSSDKGGMNIHPQSDSVALDEALVALKYGVHLIEDPDNDDPHDPSQVLDITAGALDEAALALRGPPKRNPSKPAVQDKDERIIEIQKLSEQLKGDRTNLLLDTVREESSFKSDHSANQEEAPKKILTLLVYATHTGTALKYAKTVQKNLDDEADIVNIKDLTIKDLSSRKRVFFICSTFGLGRPPREGEAFWTSLQRQVKKSNKKVLQGVEVAVAALGNSMFGEFAAFGKALNETLIQLGAKQLIKITTLNCEIGRGYQDNEFIAWEKKVLKAEGKDIPSELRLSQIHDKNEGVESACCIIL